MLLHSRLTAYDRSIMYTPDACSSHSDVVRTTCPVRDRLYQRLHRLIRGIEIEIKVSNDGLHNEGSI